MSPRRSGEALANMAAISTGRLGARHGKGKWFLVARHFYVLAITLLRSERAPIRLKQIIARHARQFDPTFIHYTTEFKRGAKLTFND